MSDPDSERRIALTRTVVESIGSDVHADDEILGRGVNLGRYVLLDRIGAGGMGVVYAAYDPELDRKVALKVLHRAAAGEASSGRARLLREAQAMARMSHPNIVVVHDVGTFEQRDASGAATRVFVAMEFVDGETLRAWRTAGARGWAEVLEAMIPIARALAAIHAAQMVHRDVKPDNIMISRDGRMRLMDFGLARAAEVVAVRPDPTGTTGDPAHATTASGPHGVPTARAVIAGTPAYMAAELHTSGVAGPASDQFSFGVTLYELLYATAPFPGTSLLELASAVIDGRHRPPPRDTDVPSWLWQVVERTLASDPSARFVDMDELVRELTRDRRRTGIKRFAAVGAIALGTGWLLSGQRAPADRCDEAAAALAEVWDERARDGVRTALAGTALPYAGDTATRVIAGLDHHAEAWADARIEVCRAGEGAVATLGVACLDDRLTAMAAWIDVLTHADAGVVERAVAGTLELTQPARCEDPHYLAARRASWTDAALGRRVAEIRRRIADARALERAGRYERGREVAAALVAEAQATGDRALEAEARLAHGVLDHRSARFREAERELVDAYVAARYSRFDEAAIRAASLLAYVVGVNLARFDEGLMWARIADGEIGSVEGDDDLGEARADVRNNVGVILDAKGDPEAAVEEIRSAIAIGQRARLSDEISIAKYRGNLAGILVRLGRADEALREATEAVDTFARLLGADHPSTGQLRNNVCTATHAAGRIADAAQCFAEVLAGTERALGPDHLDVAIAANNLGAMYQLQGDDDRAYALYRRAREVLALRVPEDHPFVAGTEFNLGVVAHQRHDDEAALAHHRTALAIRTKLVGGDHLDVLASRLEIVDAEIALGRWDDAAAELARARTSPAATTGPLQRAAVAARTGLLLVHAGRRDEAIAALRAALDDLGPGEHELRARVELGLADALDRDPVDRAAAREQATRAIASAEAAGPLGRDVADAARRWLAAGRAG